MATQFESYDVRGNGDELGYWFEASMISCCGKTFAACDSNHDVERILRDAGVIRHNNRTGTESSALMVLFSSRKAGESFLARLNNYLAKQG